mmetsp:Transcript_19358/g.42247  ORF Transcript_19358/g.42247 Transcript_19358/m.42247 type:complete len:182 (+) Transcript_19358:62-607(+)
MTGAAVWGELRLFRHRDLLRSSLLRVFERDQYECRVIQSEAFGPLLKRWAEIVVKKGESGNAVDPHDVPSEIQEAAQKSRSAEVRWLVRRLLSREMHHRGPAHFPSTLLLRGPQYPFLPAELRYLRFKTGSLRGTEMTTKIKLPDPPPGYGDHMPPPVRDLWKEGCLDDEDFSDFRKPPKS